MMGNPIYASFRDLDRAMRASADGNVSENYTGNRHVYDDIAKRREYKKSVFDGKAAVTDFITGETLHADRRMAIHKYGKARANYHTGQVDHIVPLEQVHDMAKNMPFVSDEDIRAAANSEWNYRFTQSHLNQSKQSKSNFEVAAQSLWDGKYEESARLIGDGLVAHAGVGTELTLRATANAGEYAVKETYKAAHGMARSISSQTTVDVEKRLSQSVEEVKKRVGADLERAAVPLVLASVNALVSVTKNEKSLCEAGKDVAVQTGTMIAAFEMQKIGITVTEQAMKQSGVTILKQAAKANVVANAVAIGFMVKDSVVDWLDGKLDDGQFVEQVSRKGTLFVAETTGALIGQTVIPVPVVGAVIGSVVVSVACGCIFSLMDAAKNHMARDKRNLVAKIASEALAEMKHQQDLLKEYIADDAQKWERSVREGFALIATGTLTNDVAVIAGGLDCIVTNFNRHVKFKTLEEFDEFFMDENAVLEL